MNGNHVIYPGSFDPVTVGHLDILQRAVTLFDKVTVLVAETGKAGLLPADVRVALLKEATDNLPKVEVAAFSGLLVDAVRDHRAVAVVRGIRSAGDYEHEWSLNGVNSLLDDDIEYVYLLAKPELAAVSSSLVRDVIRHGGSVAKLVPLAVARELQRRFRDNDG